VQGARGQERRNAALEFVEVHPRGSCSKKAEHHDEEMNEGGRIEN
jgi:hypothetical protein